MTNPESSDDKVAANVPATIVAFEDETAIVSLLAPIGDTPAGTEISTMLRYDRLTLKPVDFAILQKKGLRIGGTVLLQGALLESPLLLSAHRIETLRDRPDVLMERVILDVYASITPPESSDTVMVDHAVIALSSESISMPSLKDAIEDIEMALLEPCLFGDAGLVIKAPHDSRYFIVRPGGNPSPAVITAEMLTSIPDELSAEMEAAKGAWQAIPLVSLPIAPDRRSRLTAQANNLEYFDPESGAMRFSFGSATIHLRDETWCLFDATPYDLTPRLFGYDWPISG